MHDLPTQVIDLTSPATLPLPLLDDLLQVSRPARRRPARPTRAGRLLGLALLAAATVVAVTADTLAGTAASVLALAGVGVLAATTRDGAR